MNNICEKEMCTACGACKAACPKGCIEFIYDEYDNVYPSINESQCVNCGACSKVCPAKNIVEKNSPLKAYAVWNKNQDIRKNSASGGAAAGIYSIAKENGYICYGVLFDEYNNLIFRAAKPEENPAIIFQNSKYAYVDASGVYPEIKKYLNDEKKVCFIALPCQVAALKNYIGNNTHEDNLITIDLICHGICSERYLEKHIERIQKGKEKLAKKIYFRNPLYDTEQYHFTLEDSQGIFYDKMVNSDDMYQLGYHNAITYRENCYRCLYASVNRCSDIMLGDYWLIGKEIPFPYEKKNISLVYIMSQKGNDYIRKCIYNLEMIERPVSESSKVQMQLKSPSYRDYRHNLFQKTYLNTKDFEKSMLEAYKIENLFTKMKMKKLYNLIYKAMRRMKRKKR